MVPMRALVESAFGGTVEYNATTKTATIVVKDIKIVVQIGSKNATINDKPVVISGTPPTVKNGNTLLPFRFIGEALGATVGYDANTKNIVMTVNVAP
jgi:hypothetical protein